MHILGVFGPIQLVFLLVLLGIIIVIPVVLFSSRAKHKARANTLDEVLKHKQKNVEDPMDKIEKLNSLKVSGALTEEEFAAEKKKILG